MKEVEDYAEVATKEVIVDESAAQVQEDKPVAEVKQEEVKSEVKTEDKTEPKTEEKKEEAKEVKSEKKEVAPKKSSKKTLFERFEKPEEKKEEQAEVKSEPNEFQSKYEQLLAEHEALKSQKEDTSGKTLIEKLFEGKLDITGKDLKDLLKSAAGVDYSHLNTEQLIEQSIKSDPDFESLTDEEKESELTGAAEKFEAMTALEKKKYRNELLGKMNKSPEDSEVLKALTEIQNNQKSAITDPDKWYEQKATENFNATFEAAAKDFDTLVDSIVGQKLDGTFEITAEHGKEMKEWFRNDITNINLENRLETVLMALTAEARVEEAYQRGFQDAKIKNANPGKGISTMKIAPKEGGPKKLNVEDY